MITSLTTQAFELGFALSAATVLSLGPQNTLLLRGGLSGRKTLIVVGTCYACDLGCVLLGTMGLGAAIAAWPIVPMILQATGVGYLVLMSASSFKGAVDEKRARLDGSDHCTRRVFIAALMVSAFNPLVWVETVLVIGAMSSTVQCNLLTIVAIGASLGTVFRLGVLVFGARVLRPMFRRPLFRKGFDMLAGVAMAGMAILLTMDLAQ